jgi:hypothetical protein
MITRRAFFMTVMSAALAQGTALAAPVTADDAALWERVAHEMLPELPADYWLFDTMDGPSVAAQGVRFLHECTPLSDQQRVAKAEITAIVERARAAPALPASPAAA